METNSYQHDVIVVGGGHYIRALTVLPATVQAALTATTAAGRRSTKARMTMMTSG